MQNPDHLAPPSQVGAFVAACRAVWRVIADDVTAAYGTDSVEPAIAAEAVVDLGCFEAYCGLGPELLAAWHALDYDAKIVIARNAVVGYC